LQGWEPTETTTFLYAQAIWWQPWTWARKLGTVTKREPEFDDNERELLLALTLYEADLGPHGHSLSKSTSPEANPNEYASPLRYVGHGPFTDWAKKAELDRADEYRAGFAKDATPNLNGMYYTVEEITS
jgi:hypothetical protein